MKKKDREIMKNKRNVQYEFIRVVAMIFVIALHVIGRLPTDTPVRFFYNASLSLLFATCNGLFFMLSGRFALEGDYKERKTRANYYEKRIVGLLVPIVFFMVLRTAHDTGWEVWNLGFIKNSMMNIANYYQEQEYWFLYCLVGNVMLVPFLARMVHTAEKQELWDFIGIGVLFTAVVTYSPYITDVSFAWKFLLGDFTLHFFLGYALECLIEKHQEKYVMLAGVFCYVLSIYLKYVGIHRKLHDLAPTYLVIICALWFALKRIYPYSKLWLDKVILFVGKHSFSVYMIHMLILNRISMVMPFTENSNFLGYLFGVTALTLVISFAMGVVLDVTILALVKKVVWFVLFRWKYVKKETTEA